jgi:hypothetical protein
MEYTSGCYAPDIRRCSFSRLLSSTNSVFVDIGVIGCVFPSMSAKQDALKTDL